jgi:hypothetical protein
MRQLILVPVAALAACGSQPPADPRPTASATPAVPAPDTTPAVADAAPAPNPSPARAFVAADLVRQQWAKARNRERCAPVAFTDVGGAQGTARAATFGGGWAVAFDLPGTRSAYGVAGPGLLAADGGPPYEQTRRLTRQWPYFMELEQLERPSFAGYGLEGARPYRDENASGEGENSLAYVRIHRQQCTYNVWSRLGRAHLETLLRGLQMLPARQRRG